MHCQAMHRKNPSDARLTQDGDNVPTSPWRIRFASCTGRQLRRKKKRAAVHQVSTPRLQNSQVQPRQLQPRRLPQPQPRSRQQDGVLLALRRAHNALAPHPLALRIVGNIRDNLTICLPLPTCRISHNPHKHTGAPQCGIIPSGSLRMRG